MNIYLETIEQLNQELYDRFGDDYYYERVFNYSTDGSMEIINFGEIFLYDSETDGREWLEELNDYEPLLPFIKTVFNKEVDKLVKVKF